MDAQARARAAELAIDARTRHAIGDLFAPDAARLDDRLRAGVHAILERVIGDVEAGIRREAAQLLADRGATTAAELLLRGVAVFPRLVDAGVLRDPELIEELIDRVELELLGRALPSVVPDPDRPTLLARLVRSADPGVSSAALDLVACEARRRSQSRDSAELPAELYQRLAWLVAAAVREQSDRPDGLRDRDRALTEATLRILAGYDEATRSEVAAMRLAAALDGEPAEIGTLLLDALGDRQITLAVALIADASGVVFEQARRRLTDPRPPLLLFLLHAIPLDHATIARFGVALAEADPRRDLDELADAVDWAIAYGIDDARAAIAPMMLGRDFRLAVRMLARAR